MQTFWASSLSGILWETTDYLTLHLEITSAQLNHEMFNNSVWYLILLFYFAICSFEWHVIDTLLNYCYGTSENILKHKNVGLFSYHGVWFRKGLNRITFIKKLIFRCDSQGRIVLFLTHEWYTANLFHLNFDCRIDGLFGLKILGGEGWGLVKRWIDLTFLPSRIEEIQVEDIEGEWPPPLSMWGG